MQGHLLVLLFSFPKGQIDMNSRIPGSSPEYDNFFFTFLNELRNSLAFK